MDRVQIGDVLVHRGEPDGGNPYHGENLCGRERVAALREFKAGRGAGFSFWFAPSCGGARRITAAEVDWERSGL
jgi:hypothetical protein